MFDGLLKSKFYSKCKSAIKMTKTRIEIIRKKRNAMQKYLRNDIADLLKNGLDNNAYGRAEGLLVELNKSRCYDLIEQFSALILSHLAAMAKQRECPEECREAVSSLMLAAARFADLPELRELRTVFSERYENSPDVYVNKEFVEKLKSSLPSTDKKLQLMQDIAVHSGITWNSKALENKLYNETPVVTPPIKDIQVDTIGRNETRNQPDTLRSNSEEKVENGKPSNFKSVPPLYAKSENDNKKNCHPDDSAGDAKPKPRSVRSRRTKQPSARENVGGSESNRSVKQDKAAHGQRILKFLDEGDRKQCDDEERMMDKLLSHYSRKKEPHHMDDSASVLKPPEEKGKGSKHGNRDAPNRLSSLPVELTSPTKIPKKHVRATSLQPEMLSSNGHVHPKLPEYDDFVARLAAFRGN